MSRHDQHDRRLPVGTALLKRSMTLAAAALIIGACSSAASPDADHDPQPSAAPLETETTIGVAGSDAPKPGFIPSAAGDGDANGDAIAAQLEPPPLPPEFCRSADVAAVSAQVGLTVSHTIGYSDPSDRLICQFVDADETALVRVRLTAADGDPTAAASFAELVDDPTAVPIDDTTVRVGRRVAHLGASLVEVTVTDDAIADEAAAGSVATNVLAGFVDLAAGGT